MLWEAAVVQLEVKRTEAGMAGLWFSGLRPSEVTDEALLPQKNPALISEQDQELN